MGLLVFVVSAVAIPRQAFWAHVLAGSLLIGVFVLAGIPARTAARRFAIELPIVVFAVLLPFVGRGEQIEIVGVEFALEGLWGAWTVLAKATLGVGASIVVSSTTSIPDLIRGLDTLRVPRVLTAIVGFMVRYLDIVVGEFSRRRIAMLSRGYRPRWLWQTGPLAKSLGSLFIRSFERGERAHQAMVARGFSGRLPTYRSIEATPGDWAVGLTVPVGAIILALVAMVWR